MGIIFGYAREFYNPADQLKACAYHEAAHALRGHSLGVPVQEIVLNAHRLAGCYTRYAANSPDNYTHEVVAQISMAGPVAELRHLVSAGDVCWPPLEPDEGETTSELMYVLRHDCVWLVKDNDDPADKHATLVDYSELDPRKFPHHVRLKDYDDFTMVFDALICRHVERYQRIPTSKTLIRHYRQQEQICRSWLDQNWDRVGELAQLILNSRRNDSEPVEKKVMRWGLVFVSKTGPNTHHVSRQQFEKWVEST